MASNYKFSNEEMAAIKAARRETKDKRVDARLKALELRAEGMELSEVSQATGFHAAYVSQLVAKYRDHGLEAISGNHYGGNHRNMSFEEEAAILAPFKARAEKGELVEISEIETAYEISECLVGSEMCIRDSRERVPRSTGKLPRVYLKTPNAPGQRAFLRCAASFFLEIRQYSCEKMSCATQKSLAAGHIMSFQIHPSKTL